MGAPPDSECLGPRPDSSGQMPHNQRPPGRLAQLGERLPYKQEVGGSNPPEASGSFALEPLLPQGLDESKIQADYNDGILSVRIPKTALPQPRKIQIGRQSQNQMSGSQQRQMGSGNGSKEKAEGNNGTKGTKQSQRETASASA